MIKLRLEQFKSIDQDYQGQQIYHEGQRVKIVDPDSKYYGQTAKYIGLAERVKPGDFTGNKYKLELEK